jgi:hypothetical protein
LLPARESSTFFTQCIQAMETEFEADLNAYSTMRWIYYLRRIPSVFFDGRLSSTGANTRVLAKSMQIVVRRQRPLPSDLAALSFPPTGAR